MILSELQDYIGEQHKVSLAQLEVKFGIDAAALRGMLSHLVRKGRIHKLPMPNRCHGCTVCSQESLEFYEGVHPVSGSPSALATNSVLDEHSCGGACHIGTQYE